MKRHNCATLDDFYAAVGYGGIILSRILQRLKDSYAKQYSAPNAAKPAPFVPKKSNTGIIVGGESNIDVKLSASQPSPRRRYHRLYHQGPRRFRSPQGLLQVY